MLSRLLEKSFELKTQAYEKQIESLREEIKALKDEKTQLHHQLEEGRVTADSLKGEVARLSKQAKVGCAGFRTSGDALDLHGDSGKASDLGFKRDPRWAVLLARYL